MIPGLHRRYEGVGEVVAKIPLEKATPEEVKKMMQAARQQMLFDHECILRVLGVFENEQPPTILLELAEVCPAQGPAPERARPAALYRARAHKHGHTRTRTGRVDIAGVLRDLGEGGGEPHRRQDLVQPRNTRGGGGVSAMFELPRAQYTSWEGLQTATGLGRSVQSWTRPPRRRFDIHNWGKISFDDSPQTKN